MINDIVVSNKKVYDESLISIGKPFKNKIL